MFRGESKNMENQARKRDFHHSKVHSRRPNENHEQHGHGGGGVGLGEENESGLIRWTLDSSRGGTKNEEKGANMRDFCHSKVHSRRPNENHGNPSMGDVY